MKIPGSTRPPRIHGELLKLGFEVAQSSVAKYMVKRRGPPSQGWRTFLRNHAPDLAAMDLLVVPTIGFDLLDIFVIMRLDRRDLVWINVTAHQTAEWVARQITEAFPSNRAPRYMIRDRDRIYGTVVNADCVPWASGTNLLHQPHLGRTALPNGDRIDPARVFGSRHCFGRGTSAPNSEKLCETITMARERIGL